MSEITRFTDTPAQARPVSSIASGSRFASFLQDAPSNPSWNTFSDAEATLFSASQAKRYHAQRQQVLMGNAVDSVRSLPLVDDYLKRKTAGASRVQSFVASKLAEICRLAVHTRSFEYLLLHVIRTAIHKRRRELSVSHLGVTL